MAHLDNQAPAVYEFPPQKVSWLKRDLLLFANTIGCEADELHFLFVSNIYLMSPQQSSNIRFVHTSYRNGIRSSPPFQLILWFYVSLILSSFRFKFHQKVHFYLVLMLILASIQVERS